MNTGRSSKRYGKRSVRFWVTLYLVGGTILYTVAYLLFMQHGGASAVGPNYGY